MKKIILAISMKNATPETIHKFEDKIIENISRNNEFEKTQVYKYDSKESLKRVTPKIQPDVIVLNSELDGYGTIEDTIDYLREETTAQIVIMLNKKATEQKTFIKKLIENKIYDFIEAPWTPEDVAAHIIRPTPYEMVEQFLPRENIIEKDNDIHLQEKKNDINVREYKRVFNEIPEVNETYNIKKTDKWNNQLIPKEEIIKKEETIAEEQLLTKEEPITAQEEHKNDLYKANEGLENTESIQTTEDKLVKEDINKAEDVESAVEIKEDKNNVEENKILKILQLHLLPLSSDEAKDNICKYFEEGYLIFDANKNDSWLDFYKNDFEGMDIRKTEAKKISEVIQNNQKMFIDLVSCNGVEKVIPLFDKIIIITPDYDEYIMHRNEQLINLIKNSNIKYIIS